MSLPYRVCVVPFCTSTTIKTPKKMFIHVPDKLEIRQKWLQIAGRDHATVSPKYSMYFCEDHFDLPRDMENYMELKLMGSVGKIRMKPHCLPSKFVCQQCQSVSTGLSTAPPAPKKQRTTFMCNFVTTEMEDLDIPSTSGTTSNLDELTLQCKELQSNMSLATLCVKTEAEEVCVKEEAEEECHNDETVVHVKEEPECEDSAALCELYADHQIKDELVLGPEEMHRPVAVNRAEEARGRACSVRLERLLVDAARRSCRVGRRTYTLRRTSETSDCTYTASASYQCDECGNQFTNKLDLRKHIHAHLSGPSRSCNKSTLSATLKPVKESRGAGPARRAVAAEQTRAGGKRFRCSHCDYECNWISHLRHHQSNHTGEKRYKCSHCDYKSSWKSPLVRHERIHTEEKPFKCSQCDYKSSQKEHLKRHEMIHTGEKPFQCSYCNYKCRDKTNLVKHKWIHTNEKPFKCSHCGYKCRKQGHLKNHEMIHTGLKPFKCRHCDYKCRMQGQLKNHEMIHTGLKPFKCRHCDYKCRMQEQLKKHEMIHTGLKPFKCRHCDYKCRLRTQLQIHKMIHSSETVTTSADGSNI